MATCQSRGANWPLQSSRMPSALITRVKGHDGSNLADLLLEKGYEVRPMVVTDLENEGLDPESYLAR